MPEEERKAEEHRREQASACGLVRRPGSWLYRNSLSLAFALLFVLAFAAFFFADLSAYSEQRVRVGKPAFSAWRFNLSARL